MKVEFNRARLHLALKEYSIGVEELLSRVNDGLKRKLTRDELNKGEIGINYLKRVDKIFKRGLHYYLDPSPPIENPELSIFFRKRTFETELNLESKRVVSEFERFKHSLSSINKLAGFKVERKLPVYSLKDDPRLVANRAFKQLGIQFRSKRRDYLKELIGRLAEFNVLVLEFVEHHSKREKTNIDGFYLSNNLIVIKRHQRAFNREIFTLAHEFGHYLLDSEEIEQLDDSALLTLQRGTVERWCNDFAFYFLCNKHYQLIDTETKVSEGNDYLEPNVDELIRKSHLSKIAIYTHFLLNQKINRADYILIKEVLDEEAEERRMLEEAAKEKEKLAGIKRIAMNPKPISSPLLVNTLTSAYKLGLVNEGEVASRLHLKGDKLQNLLG